MRSCNYSNIHFFKLLQYKFLCIAMGLAVVAMACNQKGDRGSGKATRGENETGVHRLDTMLLGTPNTVEIDLDSLEKIQIKSRIVKAGKPKVIEYQGVRKIKAGTPRITGLPERLKVVTPGQDSIPVPQEFKVWKGDRTYPDQTGNDSQTRDTIFKMRTVHVKNPVPVPAQEPRFRDNSNCDIRYLDLEQGMSSSYLWSVYMDSRGILWLGTARGGLSRYDGDQFIHYTPSDGLNDDIIKCITEDRYGNIWYGTYKGGIGMFDGDAFRYYGTQENFSNQPVNEILADRKGNIWAGFYEAGVYKIDPGAGENSGYELVTHYTEREGLVSDELITMMEDEYGNIWFGTKNGLCWFDGNSFTHLTEDDGLTDNTVVTLLQDRAGYIWIGTGNGLNRLTGYIGKDTRTASLTKYTVKEGLPNSSIRSIREDENGILWLGTYGGGVLAYNGENFTVYDEQAGLTSNYVEEMIIDPGGNLWIATGGGGVNRLNPNSFYHIIDKAVQSILEDREGNIWLATRHDGILKFDGSSFRQYSTEQGLSGNRIYPLLEDRHGNIWAGSWTAGVNKFDGQSFTIYAENEKLNMNSIMSLTEDEEGNILLGTNGGGLFVFDGTYFTSISDKDGFYCNWDGTIINERSGNHWFCGPGINWSDRKVIRRYTIMEKIVNLEIWSGIEDRYNNIWLSTMGEGVIRFSPDARQGNGYGTFDFLTEANGLLSNTVWGVIEDPYGNIWISTEKGLNLLSESPRNGELSQGNMAVSSAFQRYKISNFTREDGLKSLSFWANSSYVDSKNRLWLGGLKTLSMLDLNSFKLPEDAPGLVLTSLEINQEFIDYRDLQRPGSSLSNYYEGLVFDHVAAFSNYPIDLELPYKMNHITFHFTAFDWTAPHELSYQYMLEGFDGDWSVASKENKAVYRKVPPGSYIFKARAIGFAGVWSDTLEYAFTVYPPWYRTWIAWILYVLGFLALVFGFIRWRTWRIKRERDELELQVRDRTKEIEQQKEEIEQQNEELQITLENLQETQSQLIQSEKLAALGGLVAGVAHEINTPVGISVTAASSLAEETKQMADKYKENKISRTEFKEYLNSANQSAKLILANMERTATMVQSFKQVSVDQSTEQKRNFKLKEYTEDVLRSLYPRLKQKKVKITLDINENLKLNSYPGAFSQILTNLVLNSLVHGFEEKKTGEIRIAAELDYKQLELSYADNGKGIPEENIDKIFDPFFTTNKAAGTGLGLHIVYNLITQKLNGTISCDSKSGEGVDFSIQVPLGD